MSTTTGNVKISQLNELSAISDGAKLKIPVSNNSGSSSTPNWESYSVNAEVLSGFLETSLGLNDVGSEKGLRSKVTDLQNQTKEYTELEKKLGKYNLVSEIPFYSAELELYISTSGEKIGSPDYNISNEISLKQGNLYLFEVGSTEGFPDDISLMTKVDKHTYSTPSGTTGTDIVYEPLPTYYRSSTSGGYGAPSSGFLVFFATEDMNVVISSSNGSFGKDKVLYEVKYGAFIETANKLLTINGELMKVIVEAIVKNKKDIDALYENTKSLGDIHVNSIDCDEFPSVQGEPMIVVADRQPSAAGNNHGDDVPNRIGQIWVNKKTGIAYIAVSLGTIEGWKQITV